MKSNTDDYNHNAATASPSCITLDEININNNQNNDNDCGDNTLSDDGDSEIWDNEIPIWVRGEQRWISGVTEQTTCFDLIEALLMDSETKIIENNIELKPNDFVIIERWRKVEQILESNSKVWKIWNAWGEMQTEVS